MVLLISKILFNIAESTLLCNMHKNTILHLKKAFLKGAFSVWMAIFWEVVNLSVTTTVTSTDAS